MRKLTDQQLAYARNRAAGVKQRESAIAAGYSTVSAAVTATNLERRADIQAAIRAARKQLKVEGVEVPAKDDAPGTAKMPKSKYTDSLEFLTDLMNLDKAPLAMRARAAEQLIPYQHARIGEKGKKEKANERAKELSQGGKKFGTKRPPKLKVLPGGKS